MSTSALVRAQPLSDPALEHWISASVGSDGPFDFTRLSGGNSNETLLISGGGGEWVLRRPPVATLSTSAHNMEREYRVLTALADTPVPAPRALGLCIDPAIVAHPVLLMELVAGIPLTGALPATWMAAGTDAAATVSAIGAAAVDALAELHAVDWRNVGLEGFGKPADYLRRQVARWRGQYQQHRTRELALFEPVASWLEANRPPATPPAIMHGDYHLDNALFVPGPPVRVSAIIDWELSTIGDPLVDLGLLLAFWGAERPIAPAMPRIQAMTRIAGAPTRAELADRYACISGRSVDDLDWYMALAFFKLAAIVEGAFSRFTAGDVDTRYAAELATDVPLLLAEAAGFARL